MKLFAKVNFIKKSITLFLIFTAAFSGSFYFFAQNSKAAIPATGTILAGPTDGSGFINWCGSDDCVYNDGTSTLNDAARGADQSIQIYGGFFAPIYDYLPNTGCSGYQFTTHLNSSGYSITGPGSASGSYPIVLGTSTPTSPFYFYSGSPCPPNPYGTSNGAPYSLNNNGACNAGANPPTGCYLTIDVSSLPDSNGTPYTITFNAVEDPADRIGAFVYPMSVQFYVQHVPISCSLRVVGKFNTASQVATDATVFINGPQLYTIENNSTGPNYSNGTNTVSGAPNGNYTVTQIVDKYTNTGIANTARVNGYTSYRRTYTQNNTCSSNGQVLDFILDYQSNPILDAQ